MDMIPASYRIWVAQLKSLRQWGGVLFVLLLLFVVAEVIFERVNAGYAERISVLEHNKAITSQQREVLQRLQAELRALDAKHNMLLKLRGGAEADDMFVNIDRAMQPDRVWFTTWEFLRAGQVTDEKPDEVNTGYFIVIPPKGNKKQNDKPETWKIQTHMKIGGKAQDHEALSSFVRKLLAQPQIHDVRVQNTQRNLNSNDPMVDFNIIVVVDTSVASA